MRTSWFVRASVLASLPLVLAGCGFGKNNNSNNTSAKSAKDSTAIATPETVPGEILVRYKPSVPGAKRAQTNALASATVLHEFKVVDGLQRVQVPAGLPVEKALEIYRADPNVLYAEPNYVIHVDAIPNDPMFGDQWDMNNSGQVGGVPDADINAPEAWDVQTGSSATIVAVTDTGVDYTHPELTQNIWVNPGEIPGNGIDDDGNGYVDDIHGIDTANNDSDPMDDNEHGTHVSGTIGAQGNNGAGVSGVNWNVQIVACKFLDANGSGSIAAADQCEEYLYDLKVNRGFDIAASNNSWGGGFFDQSLEDEIAMQGSAGTLFVAAAGNNAANNDVSTFNPANAGLPNVISVASTNRFDGLSGFSNYGAHSVDVGAPGEEILSTFPNDSYGTISGTSMATPHVTGLVALLKSQDPNRTASQLKDLVLTSGTSLPSLDGRTISGKRIRAYDAASGGALNCSNQLLQKVMAPAESVILAQIGDMIPIDVYNLNCDAAGGNVTVTVTTPGGSTSTLTLTDDGNAPDLFAGDGRYAGIYVVASCDQTLTMPWGETIQIVGQNGTGGLPAPQSVAYAPRTLVSPTVIPEGDDTSSAITSPFPISFNGTGYTNLNVKSNGFISFTETTSPYVNTALPAAGFSTMVAPFWDDLNVASGGVVQYEVQGTAPNRELIVEWNGVPSFGGANPHTFQVVFFESSSDVLFNYVSIPDSGASATVGIQTPADGASQYSFNAPNVLSGTSLLFQTVIPPNPNAPVVGALTASGGPTYVEGDTVDLSSSFTDPNGAGDGPWTVRWDFDGDGVPDQIDVANAQGNVSVSHVYVQDGNFSASVTICDKECNQGRSSAAVQVANAIPVSSAPIVPPNVVEGNFVPLAVTFSDLGTQDQNWADIWDVNYDGVSFNPFNGFVRGSQGTVTIPAGFQPIYAAGTYAAAVNVIDEYPTGPNICTVFGVPCDGESPVMSTTFTVADANPEISSFTISNMSSANEPSTVTLDVSAISGAHDDPSMDPITQYAWDFDGDGTIDSYTTLPSATHTYPDSGSYTAHVQVMDLDSFAEATVAVSIADVPPTIVTGSDIGNAVEGGGFAYQIQTTDPAGIYDPVVCSLVNGPAGLSIVNNVISWSPTFGQSGRPSTGGNPYPVDFSCDDGDGGVTAGTTMVHAVWLDADNDGMADTWELENGLDPTVNDANGDVDGDGVSNLDAFNNAFGGPYTPSAVTIVAPAANASVNNQDPAFTVNNATDLDSTGLQYVFVLYADPNLTMALGTGMVAEGAGGTTQAVADDITDDTGNANDDPANPFNVQLDDDTHYWWRARATDGAHPGPWTAVTGFIYNPVNDAPSAPAIAGPISGSQVTTVTPTLVVNNSTDVDDPAPTMRFQVFSDAAMTMMVADSGALTQGAFNTTSWPVNVNLNDNTPYWWKATAADPHGATTSTTTGTFFVNTANDLPTIPALSAPADGSVVTTLTPDLVVDDATDLDGQALTYLFEIDSSPLFNGPSKQTSPAVTEGQTTTSWTPASLTENTRYYWRARAYDGMAYGDYSAGSFFVNVANDPPTAPVALTPADSVIVTTQTPTLTIANSTDADGDTLTYEFTVHLGSATGPAVVSATGVAQGAGGQTSYTIQDTEKLKKGKTYFWTAHAVDGSGPGADSALAQFSTKGGGGGGGCGCDLAASGSTANPIGLLLGLAIGGLVLVRRRRT